MNYAYSKVAAVMSAAILVVFALGCSDEETTTPNMGLGSKVRVIHASPDAPAFDIYAEGVPSPLVTDLAYGGTSAYIDLDAGTYNFQVRPANASPTSTPVFETGDLPIPDGVNVTAVAAGLLGKTPGADDAFRVMPLVEDFDPPGAGNAIVRVIQAAADAPAMAIDIGDDETVDIVDFEPFEVSGAAGIPFPAGVPVQIAIWAATPLERLTSFTVLPLPGNTEIFLVATGLVAKLPREADGFSLLAVRPSGTIGFIRQNPVVFALHASPDAPTVDIYARSAEIDTELVDNLSFGQLSSAIQPPPWGVMLDFRAHDNGPVLASVVAPDLTSGMRYLAVATGFVGDQSLALASMEEGFSLTGNDPLLRVVHASPDAPAFVDVGIVDGPGGFTPVPGLAGLGFGEASAASGASVPLGNFTLGVAPSGTTTPVATFDLTTTAGLRAFAVMAGSTVGNGAPFRLIIVNTSVFPWTPAEVFPK